MGSRRKTGVVKNCFSCPALDRTEWCVLSQAELRNIDKAKSTREYLPGDAIYHQGDPCSGVHCFASGMVGIRKVDADGNAILVRLAYPGDTLGYRSLLAGEEHRDSAEALKPSTICFIDRAVVRSLLDANPSLGLRFLTRATKDLIDAEERILQNATLSVRARFAHLLLVLKERYATNTEDGSVVLELPLSRQDLAAMIGIRPETMSRTIRQFEDDGIARFSGRIVQVTHVDSLLDEIEPENYV